MHQSVPARITIELLPPDAASDGWTARTTVGATDGDDAATSAVGSGMAVSGLTGSVAREPRLAQPEPPAYEASSCTCHDGWCDRDHDND